VTLCQTPYPFSRPNSTGASYFARKPFSMRGRTWSRPTSTSKTRTFQSTWRRKKLRKFPLLEELEESWDSFWVLLSPSFYAWLFRMKVLCANFLWLQIGFVIFLQKNIDAKVACKMLMKITTGVNFTNILQIAFSYKSVLCSFSVHTVWVCNFLRKKMVEKTAH